MNSHGTHDTEIDYQKEETAFKAPFSVKISLLSWNWVSLLECEKSF